jgi:lysophospholipase L1-like esterase
MGPDFVCNIVLFGKQPDYRPESLTKVGARMRVRNLLCCLAVVFCWLALLQSPADAQGFSLKSGDTVVFYGDSITEQNLYNQWVELYTATRFPAMRVHFYGAGVGGDRVTGGGGGGIDERLARDVFSHKPTVVTVMLGMNDGHNGTTPDEINANYTKGYEHLLESTLAHLPGVRITLLGPSPFDEVTRPVGAKGSYNAVMEHFADVDRDLAKKYGGSFVDFNPPVVAALEKAEALDPLMAKLLLPDRVHPDILVHWVMAEALLKGWNAPSLVSSVTIDAGAGKVADAQNASVDHLERDKDTLSWTTVENALPLPLMATNETHVLLLQLTDIQQALNQEPLRVTGLAAGQYQLAIDGKAIDTFSAEDLAKGINLADFATPMRSQAQTVGWTMRDRDEAHFIHMRMLIKKADTGAQTGKPDLMDAFENSMEDAIYQAAAPKPHVFTLSAAVATP